MRALLLATLLGLTAPALADGPSLGRTSFYAQVPPAPGYVDGPIVTTPTPIAEDHGPAGAYYGPPTGVVVPNYADTPAYYGGASLPLYTRVKYRGARNAHPCAVEKIIQVPDPCQDPCDACNVRCVCIKICVPPCDNPEDVRVSRRGNRVVYDYGKYSIRITSARGQVVVNYND